VNIKPPTSATIMFSEDGYAIYMMETVTCDDPDCVEGAHARVITDYADAALAFQGWANHFLALSKAEGEA
jgi:hypothetical protein